MPLFSLTLDLPHRCHSLHRRQRRICRPLLPPPAMFAVNNIVTYCLLVCPPNGTRINSVPHLSRGVMHTLRRFENNSVSRLPGQENQGRVGTPPPPCIVPDHKRGDIGTRAATDTDHGWGGRDLLCTIDVGAGSRPKSRFQWPKTTFQWPKSRFRPLSQLLWAL